MEMSTRTVDRLRIVAVQDRRIDAAVAIEFKDSMRHHTSGEPGVAVLDLSKVDFIDSSGLGAIVAAFKHMGPGHKLALAGLTPSVEKVFRLTRMDLVFSLYTTVEDALSDLRN